MLQYSVVSVGLFSIFFNISSSCAMELKFLYKECAPWNTTGAVLRYAASKQSKLPKSTETLLDAIASALSNIVKSPRY